MDLQRERQRGKMVSTWHIFLVLETQISFKLSNRTSGFSKSEILLENIGLTERIESYLR